jgi:hypothetical protein
MTYQAIVKIDASTLSLSPSGAITGNIYIKTDCFLYPEESWNDFVVVILNDWIKSIENIYQGGGEEHLFFMDGPFFIKAALEKSHVRLLFHSDGQKIKSIVIDAKKNIFVESLFESAKEIIEECKKRKWNGKEIIDLEKSLRYFPFGRS